MPLSAPRKITGQVVAAFGRRFEVAAADNTIFSCVTRGKKTDVACGDQVSLLPTSSGQGVIETILPRKSLLYRSDPYREKIIAANVTQIIVVVAAVPSFSEELVNRCLVAAASQNLDAIIVLNKADLTEATRAAAQSLAIYRELGYPVLQLSAKASVAKLLPHLQNHLSVLVGQSGMGKSTLINALVPGAQRATADISTALDSGRHTTTHARLYRLDAGSALIDSPGMQAFGLHHLNADEMAWGFVEFRPYFGQCKFNNCRHGGDPGCALAAAVEAGQISARRLAYFRKLAGINL